MKQVQVLLIGDTAPIKLLEFICLGAHITYESNDPNGFNFWRDLREKRLVTPLAFTHLDLLSYSDLDDDRIESDASKTKIKNSLKLLPEGTRRVFVSNAITRVEGMTRTGIDLQGDFLFTYGDFSGQERAEKNLHRLLARGGVDEKEIHERGKTIELANGNRIGLTLPPEREADSRHHDYNDQAYINNARRRKESH